MYMSETEPVLETISSEENLIRRMIDELQREILDLETKTKYIEEFRRILARSKNMIPYLKEIKYKKVEEEIRVAKMIEDFLREKNLL